MVILENFDIEIDIDMDFLENIDIGEGILTNIDIDKISYRLGFGISNTPTHDQYFIRVVGIGSGSTIVYAVKRLAERVKEEGLHLRYYHLVGKVLY